MTDMNTLPTAGKSETRPKAVELTDHPLASVFPPLSKDEYEALKADIKDNGLREPISTFKGQVLDGRHRYRACKDLGIEPKINRLDQTTDPVAYVISANLRRRHLTTAQRAMAAAKLATLKRGDNQHNGEGLSIERSSQLFNVSDASTNRCKKVLSDGVPKLVQMVEEGKLPASVGEKVAGLPQEEQAELVEQTAKKIKDKFKEEDRQPSPTNAPLVSPSALAEAEDDYITELKILKAANVADAEAAVGKLVKRLQDLDFLKD
jgi:ParB-like chromosome segregation protein Spo0J